MKQRIRVNSMSKELEALHRIANANNHFKYDTLELMEKDFQIVQQGLQRLESIDNAKPSEALEMLKGVEYVADVLKVNHKIGSRDIANQEIKEMVNRLNYRIPTIKQVLIKAQEQEKVLEIINKKNVDVRWLKEIDNVDTYNATKGFCRDDLTEEEFDLLKRYLGNE